MFFWTFSAVSPIFSTLLLLKEFKKNMQYTQHFLAHGKKDQFSHLGKPDRPFVPH